jgi:hypothetical protein
MKKLTLVIALAIAAVSSYAAVNDSVSTIFPVLDMGAGARAMAMGEAFTAVSDDSSAIYWNAAGLGTVRKAEASLSYNKWFMDTMFSQFLIAVPLSAGTIGANLMYMNLGDVPVRDAFGATTQDIFPYMLGGSLGYGISFGAVSAGAALKIISQSVNNANNIGYAGDAGVLLKEGIFSAGLAIQNVGYSAGYDLPMNVKAGIALKVLDSQQHALLIAVDSQYLFRDALSLSAGAEYVYMDLLALRAGYKAGFGPINLDGLKGLSGGIGVKISNLDVDYAIVPYGDLGITQRVTLSFVFGGVADAKSPDKPDTKVQAKAQKNRYTK